jgi:HD-GYP domain-containing protein (c-di-GMP phosphodiesterase class II)
VGDEIPLEARIIGVVDAYAAMTADRPYRAALGHGQATLELLDGAGTQFDADVVDAFVRACSRRVPYTGLAAA